jgi:transcriptional regulator PpsR
MNLESTSGDQTPFSDPDALFAHFGKDDVARLAYAAGDFLLAVDGAGVVRDVAASVRDHGFAMHWVGQKWVDTVTIESRVKVEQMLDGASEGRASWRQVNHPHDGEDVPVNYRIVRPASGEWIMAIGRDLRAMSALQQRLIKTQQSMERDYLHLRQTETRYRLLFDTIAYPVLIVDGQTLAVHQANRAAHALFGVASGALDGKALPMVIEPADHAAVHAYFGAVAVNDAVPRVEVRLAARTDPVKLAATPFRQAGKAYWLVNIDDGNHPVPGKQSDDYVLEVIDKMPDAFVLTDAAQAIIVTNRAFADLVQAGSTEQLIGAPLDRFIGRSDVDLGLLRKQLRDHAQVRNFASVIHDLGGGEEPVEISALAIEREAPLFGYSLRSVARRERDLPGGEREFPRSVEQLTDLVGRKTLKEIVRESTDLIERMCIEAALVHTSDNRASAAEILGVSRQSLYSKLHRHGLGNLVGDD